MTGSPVVPIPVDRERLLWLLCRAKYLSTRFTVAYYHTYTYINLLPVYFCSRVVLNSTVAA